MSSAEASFSCSLPGAERSSCWPSVAETGCVPIEGQQWRAGVATLLRILLRSSTCAQGVAQRRCGEVPPLLARVYGWPACVWGREQCGVAVDMSIGLALLRHEKAVWRKLFELALAMVMPLSSAAAIGKVAEESVCPFCRLHCSFLPFLEMRRRAFQFFGGAGMAWARVPARRSFSCP